MTPSVASSLTPRQREVYEFIKEKIMNKGLPPTVREIGDEFKIKSPNGVMCHLKALAQKGMITREANLSRSIALVDRPTRKTELPLVGSFPPDGGKLKKESPTVDFMDVLGTGDHFAYRASEACKSADMAINKGDVLICRKQQFYRNGTLVVVTIEKQIYLRVFTESGDKIAFNSPRGNSKALSFDKDTDKAVIDGMVIGLIRKDLFAK